MRSQALFVAVLASCLSGGVAAGNVVLVSTRLVSSHTFNVAGSPLLTANDIDTLTSLAVPQTLMASDGINNTEPDGTSLVSMTSGTANLRADGVDGEADLDFAATFGNGRTGAFGANIRITYEFEVIGSTNFTLTGLFSSVSGGSRLVLMDSGGTALAGTFFGGSVSDSGTLGAGIYELEVLLNIGFNNQTPSIPTSLSNSRDMTYDLTFTPVPAPASVPAMMGIGALAMRRRRSREVAVPCSDRC